MPSCLDTLASNLVDDQLNTVKSLYLDSARDSRKLPSHQGKHSIIII